MATMREFIVNFNRYTGNNLRSCAKNESLINRVMNKANGDDIAVFKAIRTWAEANPTIKGTPAALNAFTYWYEVSGGEEEKKEPETPRDPLADSMTVLSNALTTLLGNVGVDEVSNKVTEQAVANLNKYIVDNYGTIERKVNLVIGDKKAEVDGVVHEAFDEVCAYVANNEPVMLVGPAGTGKNFLCQQVAKALGLEFYFSNAITQEYQITGFTDANGHYQPTQFYNAFVNGGLFMLDEIDASIPETLIKLNAAIANRYFDFPAPIGRVFAHKDFRVIAAGNTTGNGADYDYVGRNQLDAASTNRFGMVVVNYDPHIEEALAQGNRDLLEFCRKFRSATQKAGIHVVVSYREISRLARLDASIPTEKLVASGLVKGLGIDDLNAIKDSVMGCGKYSEAFLKVLSAKKRG